MFKKCFLPFLCLLTLNGFATIRTVSNNPTTIAQFSVIQAAIDASSSGDTIERPCGGSRQQHTRLG
jgi:hypothetical protein